MNRYVEFNISFPSSKQYVDTVVLGKVAAVESSINVIKNFNDGELVAEFTKLDVNLLGVVKAIKIDEF